MPLENRAPLGEEHTLGPIAVPGLPPGLRGTLYRNGPNPVQPDPDLHWFFGNGMVHALRIDEAGVTYRNRWVRTRLWAQASGLPAEGLPDGVANTSLVAHAGALLALEEAHLPVRLDKDTLATCGAEDFRAALPAGPFTAHPKRCPRNGNLVFFGYGADGFLSDAIRLGEISPAGEMVGQYRIHAPIEGAMIHDFAVTERFIAIPLFPLVLDLAAGGFAFRPELGSYLGVIDRAVGPDSLRWHSLPGGFAFHVANAWDAGDRLAIDLMLSEAPPLFPGPERDPPARTEAYLTRWELDAGGRSPRLETRELGRESGELPRIDERSGGRRNRHVFWTAGDAIHARDDRTAAVTSFRVPAGDILSEPVFAPRSGAEGDGWLLAIAYRAAHRRSELAILDAGDVAAGPVALAPLPVRIPDGFHGTWIAR